ncbi:hypothetical protein AVEN_219776-1 [Araneus ventricosus]|uniref:Uncharacterized protein n=1 Tax=Araneus ventricosus TaxID=182803 RepID=A0A4Y2TII4_ARAVE|nr:hypothetical protein AVEN_79043-1 [Araneus ventricosus]GBN99424.1 hypothetical protein AVEN_219776-1 [Araneus ventricosus]
MVLPFVRCGSLERGLQAQSEYLSSEYCLISQNGQVVEKWNSTKKEIGIYNRNSNRRFRSYGANLDQQDDNHEVQRPTD